MSANPRKELPLTNPISSETFGRKMFSEKIQLLQMRREIQELSNIYKSREQYVKHLDQCMELLQKQKDEAAQQKFKVECFVKEEEQLAALQTAEAELEKTEEEQAEKTKLEEELNALVEKKHKLECQVKPYSIYKDFLEQVLEKLKFKDVRDLAGYSESLLHLSEHVSQMQDHLLDQRLTTKRVQLKLEEQYDVVWVEKSMQLSQLHKVLEETCRDTLILDTEWKHIEETSAQKELELIQMKMAVLNLYEVLGGVVGPEGVEMSDTEKQLEQIQIFYFNEVDILKKCLVLMQTNPGPQKRLGPTGHDASVE